MQKLAKFFFLSLSLFFSFEIPKNRIRPFAALNCVILLEENFNEMQIACVQTVNEDV